MASCGRPTWDPNYGLTASGYRLAGHTRQSAMTISVDPSVIPLGSKVLISFSDPAYKKYNGVYTARDTGGAIKGKKIDLFFGDFKSNKANQKTKDFGRTNAKVIVLKG